MESSPRKQFLVVLFIIALLSLIPVLYTWGRLSIGGDVMIPFDFVALNKYLYQWINIQDGAFFSLNYFPLVVIYRIADFFRLSLYETSSLILFAVNFSGGWGVYLITYLISRSTKDFYLRFIPVILYLFSPALLNGWHYMYFYATLPWFFYFIFKFVIEKEVKAKDLLWLSIIIFFSSLDLPNPKYLLYLFVGAVVTILSAWVLGLINSSFVRHSLWKVGLLVGMCSYLLIPLSYFALHYKLTDYGVHIKSGYTDSGKMMDSGVATAKNMFSLHHGININEKENEKYKNNPLTSLGGYVMIFIIIFDLLRNDKNKKNNYQIKLLVSILILMFLFLSMGPNPPFGFLYEFIVPKLDALAFLRTTAGAVFVASLFYSIYIYLVVLENNRQRFTLDLLVLVGVLAASYPLISGSYYNNNSSINVGANTQENGFKIPTEYFAVFDSINQLKLNQKTYTPGTDSYYVHTRCGYFGPPIYYFMYDNYPIFNDKITTTVEDHNVGLVYLDYNLGDINSTPSGSANKMVLASGNIKILETDRSKFIPHFQIKEEATSDQKINPTLEFKKINPTKYRIIIHQISHNFQINFSESFNNGWKIYPKEELLPEHLSNDYWVNQYKILDGNDTDQASTDEVKRFLSNGLISSLGHFTPQETTHYRCDDGRKVVNYREKYTIDFISKNYHNTIQNNNLPNGYFYETWLLKPIEEKNHQVVNGYANSWNVDLAKTCSQANICLKNQDGSYDLELIVEFWPQKLFYLSLIASFVFFVFTIYLIINRKLRS